MDIAHNPISFNKKLFFTSSFCFVSSKTVLLILLVCQSENANLAATQKPLLKMGPTLPTHTACIHDTRGATQTATTHNPARSRGPQ